MKKSFKLFLCFPRGCSPTKKKNRFTAEQGLKHPWFHIEIQDHVDADSDDEGEEEGFEEGEEAFDRFVFLLLKSMFQNII